MDDDLSVLISTRDVEVHGKKLTVHEFTLVDSLEMHHILQPVIASLADVMQTEWPSFDDVLAVLVEHKAALPALMACSCDQPVQWVKALPGSEGTTLLDVFWTVNRRFFMTSAIRQIALREARAALSSSAASLQP